MQTSSRSPQQPAPTQAQPSRGIGGFFRKLFGGGRNSSPGNQQQRSTSADQFSFNSDYATRAANAIIPAVLPGFGFGGADLPIGDEDPYRLSTLPTDFRPTDLVLIPKAYSLYGNPIYLRSEAANSFCRMVGDAAAQGLTIRIFSGYRDYQHQLRLYSQAVSRNKNQDTVTRPGKSEHQLGTTADVSNSDKYVTKRSFATTAEGQWLAANAGKYGWKMTVLAGNSPRSHADEPWHLRYLGSNVNRSTQTAQQYPQTQRRGFFSRLFGRSS
jgi:D-alanyl-D-alanine carboxypeptidase